MEIDHDIWSDLINIFSEFDYNMDNKKNNQKNQHTFWEVIINVKENMQEIVENAIRANLRLCYLLEEKGQLKKINYHIFRMNYIFDQAIYRLDNDAVKGLKNFHKIILSTYGNIDEFIKSLNSVKENLSFIRKRKDNILIEKYSYLKKISLPIRGYEQLRIALLTILKKFTNLNIIITNPEEYSKFINEINTFIEKYQKLYIDEHAQYHKSLADFYQKLYTLPEYLTLECLSTLEIINVAYNLRPIKKYINTFFPDQCVQYNLEDILEKNIKCNCGYNIGEKLSIPSLNKIKPMLRKGIKEYVEKIQSKRFKPLFDNYLSFHQNSKIYKFLKLKPENIDENMKNIDSEVISEINKALNNEYPLQISFSEIAPRFSGTYSIKKLDILGSDIKEYIKEIINERINGMDNIDIENILVNLVN